MADQCEMIVGYLLPHRCPKDAMATCLQCGRRFCEVHVSIVPQGLICLACQQGVQQAVLVSQVLQDYTPEEIALFSTVSAYDTTEDSFADLS